MTQSLAGEEPVLTSGLGHGGQGGGGDQDLLEGAQPQEDAVVPGKAGEGREEDGGEEEKLITQSWNCNIHVAPSTQLQNKSSPSSGCSVLSTSSLVIVRTTCPE